MSARGGPAGGRGSVSRRASRELSPSSTSSSSSKLGSRSTTSGNHASPTGSQMPVGGGHQDWRRLVGSIRRKVRRKTTQSSNSLAETNLRESCGNRNQDDFLKATMRIFLVVSPPMGRVQVTHNTLDFFRARVSYFLYNSIGICFSRWPQAIYHPRH